MTEHSDPKAVLVHLLLPANAATYLAYYFHPKKYNEVTLGDLTQLSEWDLYGIRGIGPTYVKAIEEALAEHGLELHPDPVRTDELRLWQSDRMRLKRFGEWVRTAEPGLTMDTMLHEFLVNENRRMR